MACGKTTLGRALALRLGRPFVDLDRAVEDAEGMSVSRIFALRGEEAFRQAEHRALGLWLDSDAVVACGGGTPCYADSADTMLNAGTVVWLKASLARTIERLRLAPGKRPLVDALLDRPEQLASLVSDMMNARKEAYARAHAVFDSDRLENQQQIDDSVDGFIDLLNSLDNTSSSYQNM